MHCTIFTSELRTPAGQSKCEGKGENLINKVDELNDMSIKHQGQSKAFTFFSKAFLKFRLFCYLFILSFIPGDQLSMNV